MTSVAMHRALYMLQFKITYDGGFRVRIAVGVIAVYSEQ